MLDGLRSACAAVADRARYVRIEHERTAAYVGTLPIDLIVAVCEKAGCADAFEALRV